MCGCHMDPKKGYILNKDATPNQKAHFWRCKKGIEIIHKEPTIAELKRTWKNWNYMSDDMKKESDRMCKKLFGVTNKQNCNELIQRTDYNDL